MVTLEIRGGGALLLDGVEIGRVTLFHSFSEIDVIGEWYDLDALGDHFDEWGDPIEFESEGDGDAP